MRQVLQAARGFYGTANAMYRSKFWDRESKQPVVQVVKLLVMLNLVLYESDCSPQMRLATSLRTCHLYGPAHALEWW